MTIELNGRQVPQIEVRELIRKFIEEGKREDAERLTLLLITTRGKVRHISELKKNVTNQDKGGENL
jgi:hypothetical protein